MKIYTIYSESHKGLYSVFSNSLLNTNVQIHAEETPQVCKSGLYGSGDAINFWRLKVKYIFKILCFETEPFVFSDIDVYFFRDFVSDLEHRLGGNDFIAQFEKHQFGIFPTACGGFLYIRPNGRTRKMFLWMLKHLDRFGDDQKALNAYIYTHPLTKMEFLPKTYYSINYDNGNKIWNGEDVSVTIKNPFMIHYHWTTGIENKLKLLKMVKRQVC